MPFYWGDFYRDTRHLSKLQRDSYMCLIGHYWTTGALPDDDQQLARITDCTLEEWQADRSVLQALFHDGWKHKRIEAELRRQADKIAKAREHGQKGGQVAALNREVNRHKLQTLGSGRYSGR
jgi:uncharacterized protein YdaU (DUF1376 family)